MIAEFANYRSWIAWVPMVALLVIPILFRHVLAVSLAMVGAFAGFVAIMITMPLGSDADQLGANTALGLVGGAVVGALLGAIIDALRRRALPRDASVIVVGCAMGGGILGALIGGFGPSLFGGRPDVEVPVLGTIAVGGGIGWAIGTAAGWRLARTAPPPERFQRWILAVAAVSIAVFGAGIVATIQSRAFGPPIDQMTRMERDSLPLIAALYCIDSALAVSTVIAVAARGVIPRPPTAAALPLAQAQP
jgi:hypothetical protein